MSTKELNRASLEQLRAYIHTRDETGWYYGNKEQFEQRHRKLLKWIDKEIRARATRNHQRRTKTMINTELLPRPFSSDRPRVEGYSPLISGKVTRIGRRKRNSWRAEATVDGTAMSLSHHDTKTEAERHLAGMIETYTEVHYIQI